MTKRVVAVCLLLAIASPVLADVTVLHVNARVSGWRGGTNISPSYCWIDNWPNANADGTLAEFSRTDLQNAINSTVAQYGGWDAKLIVTQPEWTGNPDPVIPANLDPVVASVDIDPSTLTWGSSTASTAGAGQWRFNSTNYANFVAAVNAGVAAGKSVVAENMSWQAVWKPSTQQPFQGVDYYDIVIDVPESLIVSYLNNTSADGLFVGAKLTGSYVGIYTSGQWGNAGDIRVLIAAPPAAAPWITTSVASVTQNVALDNPTASIPVTVTNGGGGTLAWTATESPAVNWLSLANASGAAGGQFQINVNVTGLTPGTYTTNVQVAATGAGNTPVSIPVSITVLSATAPTIQLSPTSLSFTARQSDASPPAGQAVTVQNSGFGTLTWTVAEAPDVSWLTVAPTSGAQGGQFAVTVNHAGLPANIYTATVRVSGANATNSPQDLTVTLTIRDQDADIVKANSYDDGWESGLEGWVPAMKVAHRDWSGSDGFCVLLGDSITYANPFSQWPRYGSGKTADDNTICNWMHAGTWGSGGNNSTNGWYLAAWDARSGGSYTARSGIRADQYVAGSYGLPSIDQMFTAGFTNPDGKQYRDAEIAVILLGTNDASSNRTAAAVAANLATIIDKIMANGTVVVLTTLPPKTNDMTDVQNINAAIRDLAVSKKLPLIDFYEEVMRRRPGDSWQNTLISSDGVHPSATYGGSSASSDPYASSGLALSNSGYLLRSWLTTQKIKEIRAKVLQGLAGDIDGDGSVDIFDIFMLAEAWNTQTGDPAYSRVCDLDDDGSVNIFDIFVVAEDWGK